jgi:hypothetical protein
MTIKKLLLLLVFTTTLSFAQQVVSIDSIAKYEGKRVTICEKVKSTFVSKKSNTTILNFGKSYPNQTFVVVIFEKDLVNFSYIPSGYLKDKTICVTGTVVVYGGKPEFIIKEEKDIVLK